MNLFKEIQPTEPKAEPYLKEYGDNLVMVRVYLDSGSGRMVHTVELKHKEIQPELQPQNKDNHYNDSENLRLIKRILSGLDLIYSRSLKPNKPTQPDKPKKNSELPNQTELRLLIACNKVEQLHKKILFIQAETPYCSLYLDPPQPRQPLLHIPLTELVTRCRSLKLLRVHRSYVVPIQKVQRVMKVKHPDYELLVKDIDQRLHHVPVGRSYLKKLRNQFPQWFVG